MKLLLNLVVLVGIATAGQVGSAREISCFDYFAKRSASFIAAVAVACSGLGCESESSKPAQLEVPVAAASPQSAWVETNLTVSPPPSTVKALAPLADLRPLTEEALAKNQSWETFLEAVWGKGRINSTASAPARKEIQRIIEAAGGGVGPRDLKVTEVELVLLLAVHQYVIEPMTQNDWRESAVRAQQVTPLMRDLWVEWNLFFEGLAYLNSNPTRPPTVKLVDTLQKHSIANASDMARILKR